VRATASELRNFGVNNVSVEDLALVLTDLIAVDSTLDNMQVETPEWVHDKIIEIKKEIDIRNDAELRRKLKEAEARADALKTPAEKRAEAKKEIVALRKRLGMDK
jgi:hypothetical protein